MSSIGAFASAFIPNVYGLYLTHGVILGETFVLLQTNLQSILYCDARQILKCQEH